MYIKTTKNNFILGAEGRRSFDLSETPKPQPAINNKNSRPIQLTPEEIEKVECIIAELAGSFASIMGLIDIYNNFTIQDEEISKNSLALDYH